MSKAIRLIRPALPEDINELVKLRREYCQQTYKGFDVLCNLEDDQEYAATLSQWFGDPTVHISLLYLDDALMAFSVYRLPNPKSGEILDLQCLPGAVLADIQALMESILKEMAGLDLNYVEVWVLRDNLRARYHYQQFGFKPVGGNKEMVVGDVTLLYTRYIYCLKECPPDCI
jgi:hypothetical protein